MLKNEVWTQILMIWKKELQIRPLLTVGILSTEFCFYKSGDPFLRICTIQISMQIPDDLFVSFFVYCSQFSTFFPFSFSFRLLQLYEKVKVERCSSKVWIWFKVRGHHIHKDKLQKTSLSKFNLLWMFEAHEVVEVSAFWASFVVQLWLKLMQSKKSLQLKPTCTSFGVDLPHFNERSGLKRQTKNNNNNKYMLYVLFMWRFCWISKNARNHCLYSQDYF